MILSFPLPGGQKKDKEKENQTAADGQGPGAVSLWTGDAQDPTRTGESSMFGSLGQGRTGDGSSRNSGGDSACPVSTSPDEEGSYETQMESRIKNLLKSVSGVGKVDVMVALKSSSEKVIGIDRSASSSATQGKDSGRDTREVTNSQPDESTVLSNPGSNGSGNVPIIEKKLSLEISRTIINTKGGGNPTVKVEISEIMKTSSSLSPYKIKVLKRVE